MDKGICNKEFIWNPCYCEYQCDKSCDVRENLNYENYKCRKNLVDKLVEEYSEGIYENKMIWNTFLNENVCDYFTMYILLFAIAFLIIIYISSAFIYFHWYLKRSNAYIKTSNNTNYKTGRLINKTYKWKISNKLIYWIEHIFYK